MRVKVLWLHKGWFKQDSILLDCCATARNDSQRSGIVRRSEEVIQYVANDTVYASAVFSV